jgi:putative membrane protein
VRFVISEAPTSAQRQPIPVLQYAMIAFLALVTVVTSWHALYPRNTLLQHAPTVLLIFVSMPMLRRWPLSNAAVACVFGFFLLHAIGARYSYSFVPYDDWARAMTGHGINEALGFARNHYDRLVHFCFGALAIRPVREIAARHCGLGPRAARYIAPQFVMAFSACYEIFEWLLAVTMSPADAEAYNGQQGDPFDAQKDMAFAFIGALATTIFVRRAKW